MCRVTSRLMAYFVRAKPPYFSVIKLSFHIVTKGKKSVEDFIGTTKRWKRFSLYAGAILKDMEQNVSSPTHQLC